MRAMASLPDFRRRNSWLWLAVYASTGLVLLGSWLWCEPGRDLWQALDEHTFRRLNGSLAEPGLWQTLWALANSRLADAVPAALLLLPFAHWMFADEGRHWRVRGGIGAALAVFTLLWNQSIVKPWLDQGRLSPTLVLDNPVRLEHEPAVAWVPLVKDHAEHSFPGDHAGVFVLVTLVIGHVCGWRRALPALVALPFVMLPRLFGGGHWLSDQIVGGGFVGLVGGALFLGLLRLGQGFRERRAAAA